MPKYTRQDFILCVAEDVCSYEGVDEDYDASGLVAAALDAGELTLETPITAASALIARRVVQA